VKVDEPRKKKQATRKKKQETRPEEAEEEVGERRASEEEESREPPSAAELGELVSLYTKILSNSALKIFQHKPEHQELQQLTDECLALCALTFEPDHKHKGKGRFGGKQKSSPTVVLGIFRAVPHSMDNPDSFPQFTKLISFLRNHKVTAARLVMTLEKENIPTRPVNQQIQKGHQKHSDKYGSKAKRMSEMEGLEEEHDRRCEAGPDGKTVSMHLHGTVHTFEVGPGEAWSAGGTGLGHQKVPESKVSFKADAPLEHGIETRPCKGRVKLSMVLDMTQENSREMDKELADLPEDQWQENWPLTQGGTPCKMESFPVDHLKNANAGGPGVAKTGRGAKGVAKTGRGAKGVAKERARPASGFYGVTAAQQTNGRWKAQIHYNSKQHTLGIFDTKQEAALAYDREARRCVETKLLNYESIAAAEEAVAEAAAVTAARPLYSAQRVRCV